MTPFFANPFIFVFSIVVLVAVVGYFGWGAADRLGLPTQEAGAVVKGRHYNPPGVTYRTIIAGGRTWTQADSTNDSYILQLEVNGEATVAVVSKVLHDAVKAGDTVRVRTHRTRLSKRLEVIDAQR
jgi:hypothetical protein